VISFACMPERWRKRYSTRHRQSMVMAMGMNMQPERGYEPGE